MAKSSLPLGCSLLLASPAAADLTIPGNIPSPEAVREVAEGRRATANAAWWGFDAEDATQALQAAIDSGRPAGGRAEHGFRLDRRADSAGGTPGAVPGARGRGQRPARGLPAAAATASSRPPASTT